MFNETNEVAEKLKAIEDNISKKSKQIERISDWKLCKRSKYKDLYSILILLRFVLMRKMGRGANIDLFECVVYVKKNKNCGIPSCMIGWLFC